MWNLKNNTSESTCKTETGSQTQKTNLPSQRGEVVGEGQIRRMGLTDTNHYIYDRQATVSLCSTRNYKHYLLTTYKGK